jgi:hypothetical protein
MKITPLLAVALLLTSCGKPSATDTAEGSLAESATGTVAADGPERQNVCLWNELGVRETASEKGKYMTSIYLGERLQMTGDSATETSGSKTNMFYKVTLSDGKSGWVNSTFLAKDVVPAAVVTETSLYKRPDAATVTDVKLYAVEYVVAWPAGNGWAKVKTKRTGDKWFVEGYVQEKSLLYDRAEVDFAALSKRANETDKAAIKDVLMSQLQEPGFTETRMYMIYFGVDEGGPIEEYEPTEEELANDEPGSVSDLPDLNSAFGNIINIYGESDYWYVYNGIRYRLQETSAENITNSGISFYHCTQAQLNEFSVSDKVLDYIPSPGTNVE